MYVYLIFKSTKDVILKIKSIAKGCILDSYKKVLWKFLIYTWIGRSHQVKDTHIMSYMQEILKRREGAPIYRIS